MVTDIYDEIKVQKNEDFNIEINLNDDNGNPVSGVSLDFIVMDDDYNQLFNISSIDNGNGSYTFKGIKESIADLKGKYYYTIKQFPFNTSIAFKAAFYVM